MPNLVKSLQEKVLKLEEVICKENKALENKELVLVEKDKEIINTNQALLKITEENDLLKNNEKCLQSRILQLEQEARESKELISIEREALENKTLLHNKLVLENSNRKNANLRKENEMLISENKNQALRLDEKVEKLRALDNKVIVNNLVIQKAYRDNAKLISEKESLEIENKELKYKLRFVEEKFEDAWR